MNAKTRKDEEKEIAPGAPLPRGRHDLAPGDVKRHQRGRLIAAVVTELAECGYESLTVGRVIAVARVSRSTFYEHFAGKRDAVLQAHCYAAELYLEEIREACKASEDWPHRVRLALVATFRFGDENSAAAKLLTTSFEAVDPLLANEAARYQAELARLMKLGRRDNPEAVDLPEITEDVLIRGIAAVLGRRLLDSQPVAEPQVQAEMLQITLTPYLGSESAAEFAAANG